MRKTKLVQKIKFLKKNNKVLEDIVMAQNHRINDIENTSQPAAYENGVMVSMARVKYDAPLTSNNKTGGIKWYEDTLKD